MSDAPRILVVDDEAVVVAAVDRILTSEGFSVRTAGDVAAGIRVLETWVPALLLTDLKLPGRSGIELIREVLKRWPEVVVLAMTGYANPDHAVESLTSGAFDFLPKPFAFDELLAPVRRGLRAALQGRRAAVSGRSAGEAAESSLLGWTSWVRIEEEGTALLGLTEAFISSVDRPVGAILPDPNRLIQQGGELISVVDAGGDRHIARAALGGRAVEVNASLERDPSPLTVDPYGEGWIARVIPDRLREEMSKLVKRGTASPASAVD